MYCSCSVNCSAKASDVGAEAKLEFEDRMRSARSSVTFNILLFARLAEQPEI